MRKTLHVGASGEKGDVVPRRRVDIAFSTHIHIYRFLRGHLHFREEKTLFMNFVVQRIFSSSGNVACALRKEKKTSKIVSAKRCPRFGLIYKKILS